MQDYPDREVSREYVRCCAELPCSVASDLRARVRELEEGLGRIAEWPVGDALYAVKEMRAIAAHALLTTPTKMEGRG